MLFDDLASGCSSRTQWGLGFGLDRPPGSGPESRPPTRPGRAEKSHRPGGQQERGVALPGLVAARHALGLSQVELAQRAGLGVATISRLERGGRAHSTTIDLLVTALGVTRARLLRAPRKRTARLPTPGDPAS